MYLKSILLVLTLSFLGACSSTGKNYHHKKTKVEAVQVEYATESTELQGTLYKPKKQRSKGGILVVHEWYGLNDYAQMRAKKLAKMGYTTFAVDMYGKGKRAEHPKDAQKFMEQTLSNPEEAKRRFEAAIKVLEENGAQRDKIVSVGYCFGGGVSLNMLRSGVELAGVASFHGSLAAKKKAKKGDIQARVLVANGGADPMVPNKDVKEFVSEMHNAGVDLTFMNFKDALHSFTSKEADEKAKKFDLPIGYDKQADKQSWKALKKFLKQTI